METPDTPAQATARKMFDEACRELAAASARLNDAKVDYYCTYAKYNMAFGAAMHAGVLPK